jgi:hypothetical protein
VTSVFQFPGGAANSIKQIITGTTPTVIVLGLNAGQYNIAWFRCNEYAGGVANLTVEIYDGTNSHFLGSGGFTWNAKALTAKQSVLFDDGYVIPNGSSLRVTASIGSNVMVTGVYVGKQATSNWRP